ncbi:hypothetical protein BC939DRAFT_444384 [Gamsiella multidivaricata]|uniref:uncharacterized protein n=1 Tax=Gamsiella multidivaricata TaxID=101098 RepID=UPI002220DF30|nr:uncharacterized protein BC939DRAFT_444384 [Gamsiella multidivaricata]KAI7828046.1 hypothetical protein BC939DRAFT_444384 [Gamsiella multidivaricata]
MDSLLFSPLLLLLPLSPATLTLLLVLITFSFFLFNSFLIPPSCLIVSIAKKQKQKRKVLLSSCVPVPFVFPLDRFALPPNICVGLH